MQTPTGSKDPPRIAIVGVGNLLLGDEGIGVHAIRALQQIALPPDVRLIDGGTVPEAITGCGAVPKLVIIDAIKSGNTPGSIYRLKPQDLASLPGDTVSAHELGVLQSLQQMQLTGTCPEETIIIAVEPAEIGWGTELSDRLKQAVPAIVKAVLREIGIPPSQPDR